MKESIGAIRRPTRLGILCGAMLTCMLAHNPAFAWPKSSSPAPTTAAATWQLIDKNLAQLENLIRAGKIGDLGSSAYGIANAFKLLPGQSSSLPSDKLAEVRGDVNIVGSEVSKLDKAGEHGDPKGVQSNLRALKATLAKVRAYYPR